MPWYLEDSGVSTYTCRVSIFYFKSKEVGEGEGGVPLEHLYPVLKEINMFIAKDTTSKTTKYYSTNFDHIQSVHI